MSPIEKATPGAPSLVSCLSVLLAFALLGSVAAQESPIEKAATAGKIKILRPAGPTSQALPDLLIFKTGKIVEAWDLSLSGDLFRYKIPGPAGDWLARSFRKNDIRSILLSRSLDEHLESLRPPPEPEPIRAADTQPVLKHEILSGRFIARQSRHTRWTFDFKSELNKLYTHAEEATEYGIFKLRSYHFREDETGTIHENEVVARGKYFLYAPGAFNNEDWVLNLTQVSYIENDVSPSQSFFSDRLGDEVLVIRFAPDRNVFSLKWANYSGWQWTAPVQQTYYRGGKKRVAATGDGQKINAYSFLPPNLRAGTKNRATAERSR